MNRFVVFPKCLSDLPLSLSASRKYPAVRVSQSLVALAVALTPPSPSSPHPTVPVTLWTNLSQAGRESISSKGPSDCAPWGWAARAFFKLLTIDIC